MEAIQNQQPSTDSGVKPGLPAEKPVDIRLLDLPGLLLGQSEQNAWKATDGEFYRFAAALVEIQVEEGDSLERPWLWEDRRDFINFCLDEHILSIQDGRLVELEATIPTQASLSADCLE